MYFNLCAGIKQRDDELRDIVMTDVCPFSLGVATYDNIRDTNPHMAALIQRSSMLPVRRTERFFTLSNNQQRSRLEIYQGENYYASENLCLGELPVSIRSRRTRRKSSGRRSPLPMTSTESWK